MGCKPESMDNNQSNSCSKPDKEMTGGDTAMQKAESFSHFKRTLVPLDEYAAQQGISSDIIEQQGQLGVIQIRKFKGHKFVVDVAPEQLSEFENDEDIEIASKYAKPLATTSSKIFTIGLAISIMVIVVGLFWLYMATKTKLDDLSAEYTSIQKRYNDLTSANQSLKAMQEQLVGAKVEFARIQNRIAASRTDMEKIQGDLNKTKRNFDVIQSELNSIQGQMALSKVEIESIQNSLNESKNQLDTLYRQNSDAGAK
jgi:septal ring factor EnvC (AmiA/AmiB activator)